MRYGSICSGIEAASVAFKPLGWEAAWFSEIDKFPSAVLAHHYPEVPNYGDMTTIAERILKGEVEAPDMICGGTPCQAFSVAGLRNSLDDDRGNLTLQFIKICDANDTVRRASGREDTWILYENVPGLLSTHDNAFGSFLGGLVGGDTAIPEPENGWPNSGVANGPRRVAAWRTLNAEYFGLAQRRKRVFVLALGGAGRWAAADAILPIVKSSEWHPAPSRSAGQGTARGFETGPSGSRITDLEPTIDCRAKNGPIQNQLGVGVMEVIPEVTRPLTAAMGTKWNGNGDLESSLIPSVSHTLRGEGFDASEDGTGRGIPLVMSHGQANAEVVSDGSPSLTCNHEAPIVFDPAQVTSVTNRSNPQPGDPCHTPHQSDPPMLIRMREGKEGGGKGPLVSNDQSLTLATANDQVLAFHENQRAELTTSETAGALKNGGGKPGQGYPAVQQGMQVRRLTPIECARLQGFPDTYLDIIYRGKPAADGNKYKALGNSWAVPVVRWIGERINAVKK